MSASTTTATTAHPHVCGAYETGCGTAMSTSDCSAARVAASIPASGGDDGMAAQTQPDRDHQRPKNDREDADREQHAERARARVHEEEYTEQHCNDAGRDEPPLVGDLLAQPDRTDDLHDSRRDRPTSDEEEEDQCGHRWPHERQHACTDAYEAGERQPPARLRGTAADRRHEREDAIGERK